MSDIARTDLVTTTADPAATPVAVAAVDDDVTPDRVEPSTQPWSLPTRIGFRFVAAYFFLYTFFDLSLFATLFTFLPFTVPHPQSWAVTQQFNLWVAKSWLQWPEPYSRNGGAGDKPIDYALVIGLLAVAVALTLLWSAIDWKRKSYPRGLTWFRLMLRLGVATSLAAYGWMKFFPLQMSPPSLTRMLEPYGHFSLMAVLWTKIGSSTSYEIFTGIAELLATVLLLIPGLTTVGALIAVPVTFQIWMLNMTYDVPVKLFSFHLLAMSTLLLLPDLRRLATFLVLKRATDPPRDGRLFRNVIAHRLVLALQVVFAVWFLWTGYNNWNRSYAARQAQIQQKPPLYGIWNIDRMWINGVERAPLLTDYGRWRRLVFQQPGFMQYQRMDDTFDGFSGTTDLVNKAIVFTQFADPKAAMAMPPAERAKAPRKETGRLTIEQPAPGRLILDGAINGTKYRIDARYFDPAKFRLMQAKFNLMADRPWNVSSSNYAPELYR